MMRKKVVSFDRFYEQKNSEYMKLLNQNPSLRAKTAKRKRIFTYQSRCPTQTANQTITSKRAEGHFLVSGLQSRAQSPQRINKTSTLKRNDRVTQRNLKKAILFENQQNLFSNSYLRQRLKLSKISQCKTKEIVFSQKFEHIHGLNSRQSFKIRSNKFNLLSSTINPKQHLLDPKSYNKQDFNPQSYFSFNQ